MGQAENNHKINYIEFPSSDIEKTKQFYFAVFGWSFEDWGPEYVSFSSDAGVAGGFMKSQPDPGGGQPDRGGPLVVLYATNLAATEAAIVAAGGTITVPTFEYPGGRRFHFADGVGNQLAVWSE